MLPARFCLHRSPGGDSPDHIDLFVLPAPDAERLWTFELPVEFADALSAAGRSHPNTPIFQLKLAPPDSEGWNSSSAGRHASKQLQTRWPAVRKGDHRRLYWNYSGVIAPLAGQSANQTRGTLSELGRGWLDLNDCLDDSGPPSAGVPLQLWLSESQSAAQEPFSQ